MVIVVPPAPAASSTAATRTMRANRRRDTAPELALRRELWRRGHRYLVDATPAGTSRRRRADVVLRGARIAVFVDGCFWHSCPSHLHVPKANRAWWEVELASIVERDARTDAELAAAGWLPLRVWEHEAPAEAADRIGAAAAARRAAARGAAACLTTTRPHGAAVREGADARIARLVPEDWRPAAIALSRSPMTLCNR